MLKSKKSYKVIFVISIILFLVSLTQKTYCIENESCQNFSGLLSFLFGWFGIIFMLHIPTFVWLANPILIISWIRFKKKPKSSLILSFIASIIMLSFLFVDEILVGVETTKKAKIISHELGYWLWVSSAIMLCLASYLKK